MRELLSHYLHKPYENFHPHLFQTYGLYIEGALGMAAKQQLEQYLTRQHLCENKFEQQLVLHGHKQSLFYLDMLLISAP